MSDEAPLFFDVHLGMLRPANAKAEEAMREIKGRSGLLRTQTLCGVFALREPAAIAWRNA